MSGLLKPWLLPVVMGGGASYASRIKSVLGANLLSLPDTTQASGATLADLSGNSRTVAVTGFDLANAAGPDGKATLFVDGLNDYGDWYTASLNAAMNKAEFTIGCWFKVNAAAVWTDDTARVATRLAADANNFITIQRNTVDNQLGFTYKAGGTTKFVNVGSLSGTGWYFAAMSVSKTADQLIAYLAAQGGTLAQTGTTQTSLGTWGGNLSASLTLIGASNKTPTLVWHGWLAYPFIANGPQSLTTLQALML